MNNYGVEEIVSKLGITLVALLALLMGNVMMSRTNVDAHHVRTERTRRMARKDKAQHRRTKGAHVKRAKRIHRFSKKISKRHRGRKSIARVKPRKMKIERRGTDDPVSIEPKEK